MKKLLSKINICAFLANHLIGENHKPVHCCTIGVIVITVGTYIANIHTGNMFINMGTEAFGYVIHGVGSIPIIDAVAKSAK